MSRVVLAIAVFLLLSVNAMTAQMRVGKNVVDGMHSGLALLMDVYYPEKLNGYGVIVIPGSGWRSFNTARPVLSQNAIVIPDSKPLFRCRS